MISAMPFAQTQPRQEHPLTRTELRAGTYWEALQQQLGRCSLENGAVT